MFGVPLSFLWLFAKRLSIIPDPTIAECKPPFIGLDDLMTFGASDMTGGQFHNLAIIFSWDDQTC
jgi:hypothetical protein